MISKKRKSWTPDEEEILLQKIRDTPNNLTYAFEEAKKEMPRRTVRNIKDHWYGALKNNPETGAIFGMISARGAVANTKNMRRPEKKGEQWAMSLAELAISKMNKAERMEIIEKIMQMK